jgi:hypothetical protein
VYVFRRLFETFAATTPPAHPSGSCFSREAEAQTQQGSLLLLV